ncbi:MAG: LemA family protein [Spirochaetota bacterium]
MDKNKIIKFGIIGAVILFIIWSIASLIGTYNSLVTLDESVKSSWAQVENVYQRRLDLIPNLVATTKGYAKHESDTLIGVIAERSKASQIKVDPSVVNDPQMFAKFQASQGAISSALSRLMVVVEQYPNLKANENFMNLQSQLEGTENRIAVERKRFNEVAQTYNTKRRSFPIIFFANMFGFKEKAYFTAEEGAKTAPKVDFSK